ncbi:MAG: very short patch repair endonuclease [Acidobacteriota bacterium]|nr:very short patch repair endonuclease [Acidobacteriota bacterium]
MDHVSKLKRSQIMAAVRSKDTSPELAVRRIVHGMGFRYSLHRRSLPGTPDLVFTSRGKVIFVHGCFWHRHSGCKYTTTPKTRVKFWKDKFDRNVERDRQARRELRRLGWRWLTVWQCDLKRPERLVKRLEKFLCAE